MATLRLLGPVDLRDDSGRELRQLIGQPKRFALLAYLAGNAPQTFHRRDRILAVFWPESTEDQARHGLRQVLFELRNHLGENVIVRRGTDEIALNEDIVTCDVAQLHAAIASGDLDRVTELYRGAFLDGFFVTGESEVERWIESRRVEMLQQVVHATWRLVEQRKDEGDLRHAVAAAERAVVWAPTDEVGVRRLLVLLQEEGNTGEAFRVYDRLARRLAEEFDATPSPETTTMIARIRAASGSDQRERVTASSSPPRSGTPETDAQPAAARAGPASLPLSRSGFIAVIVLSTLSALLLLGQAFSGGTSDPAAPIEARWVIVAEIDGSADSAIRDAVKDLVTAALEQSPAVRTLPEANLSRGLLIAGKRDTARLTEELARELAVRGQIPVVFVGRVNRIGSTYALSFRAVTADSGAVVVTTRSIAESEDELIPRVNEAAIEFVRSLEDDPAALGPIRPLVEVRTPSMAALLKFREGRMGEAVGLDSAFAEAWFWGASYFANRNQLDSLRWAAERALRNPERLTSSRLYATRALVDFAEHDYPAAYRNSRSAWESAGRGGRSAVNMAVILSYMGQWERAVEAIQFTKPAPFGRGANTIVNELNYLLASDRFDDVPAILDELADVGDPPSLLRGQEMEVHVASARWTEAERAAVQQTNDPTALTGQRLAALTVEASALAARGEVRAATARLLRGRQLAADADDPGERTGVMDFTQRLHLLDLISHRPRNDVEVETATVNGLLEAALNSALLGESVDARNYLRELRALPHDVIAPLASAPDVVESVLTASAGNWDSVIVSLRPLQAWVWPHRLRYGPALGGLVLTLLAQAYEATDQLDSAASYYEKLGSPIQLHRRWEAFSAGLTYAFAHQRLVVLYARMGRIEDAGLHWKIFSETFTNPDPELVHLADEALAALERANVR